MTIIVIILSVFAVYLLKERGGLTTKPLHRFTALALLLMSCGFAYFEYGALRGVITVIGIMSLAGTLITLLSYKRYNHIP